MITDNDDIEYGATEVIPEKNFSEQIIWLRCVRRSLLVKE